jgi:cell wall-associated NlpC family hydrolase
MPVLRNVAMLIAVSGTAFVGAAPPANAGIATPPSPTARRAASFALQEINAPWAFGGSSVATGFDSSGLVVWAFGKAGRKGLPHLPQLLRTKGAPVSRENLERGDVVFFDDAGYAGIYLGHGRFIHASSALRGIRIDRLAGYYEHHLSGAVRIK